MGARPHGTGPQGWTGSDGALLGYKEQAESVFCARVALPEPWLTVTFPTWLRRSPHVGGWRGFRDKRLIPAP